MQESVAAERLAGIELFDGLTDDELAEVASMSRLIRAPVGRVLIEENDLSSTFFVLLEGSVTVHRQGRHIDDMGSGEFFGEAGTTTLTPRNASVMVTTPVEAVVIMGWDVRRLLDEMPRLKRNLDAAVAARGQPA